MVARRYLISGRVQGVNFRAATRHRALELHIQGHARNLADGRVEVQASGDQSALVQLEEFLRRGPPFARVTAVESTEIPDMVASGFSIG